MAEMHYSNRINTGCQVGQAELHYSRSQSVGQPLTYLEEGFPNGFDVEHNGAIAPLESNGLAYFTHWGAFSGLRAASHESGSEKVRLQLMCARASATSSHTLYAMATFVLDEVSSTF